MKEWGGLLTISLLADLAAQNQSLPVFFSPLQHPKDIPRFPVKCFWNTLRGKLLGSGN